MKTYFTCKKCRYTFYEEEGCAQCTDCGKHDIRSATEEEIAQYLKYREEFKVDNPNKKE